MKKTLKISFILLISLSLTTSINVLMASTYGDQNFTTFTESDSLNRLSQTSARSTFTGLEQDDHDIYLYKDYGVSFFDDFEIGFNINISRIDSDQDAFNKLSVLTLTDTLGDVKDVRQTEEMINVILRLSTSNYVLRLQETASGATYNNDTNSNLNLNTEYYVNIIKNGVDLSLEVYTNSSKTQLVSCSSLDLHSDVSFRYLTSPNSLGFTENGGGNDGYIENLVINSVFVDFTTFTETDTSGRLSQTSTTSTFTGLEQDDHDIYLYKDYGINYFNGFRHDFEVNITRLDADLDAVTKMSVLTYTNTLGDVKDVRATEEMINILLRRTGDNYVLRLQEAVNGTVYNKNSATLDLNTEYYVSLNKNGTSIEMAIYNSSERTHQISYDQMILHSDWSFRYLTCPNSLGFTENGGGNDGYVEYLSLSGIDIIPPETTSSYEDFTSFTESDASNKLTQNATRSTFTDLDGQP